MNNSTRLIERSRRPTDAVVASFIGRQNRVRWEELTHFIAANYPGVFDIEWLYGGEKHGWSLRYKKSKSFCTFVPERKRFKFLLVFGAAEREKAKILLPRLKSHVPEDYEKSKTYHDGKWVFLNVDSAKVVSDIKQLLMLKRAPRAVTHG